MLWDEVLFREMYKLSIECSLYEDVSVVDEHSDQKNPKSKVSYP